MTPLSVPDDPSPGSSWEPVDLAPILAGGHVDPAPSVLVRSDGPALLYPGKVHTVSGESESLKSWLLQVAAAQQIGAGGVVVWIDFEDSAPAVTSRLLALGATPADLLARFHYIRPAETLGIHGATALTAVMNTRPGLAVIDGVTEAMSTLGLDLNSNADVATFYGRLPRPLARLGPAVCMIDHVPKSKENRGRYALGGQHKLAGLDGAAYVVEIKENFGHGRNGSAHVAVVKDRPGRVREHCPGDLAAVLHLESNPDGTVDAHLAPPPAGARSGPSTFRPTVLMQRVSEYVESNPGLSGRAIEAAVRGKSDAVRLARELLVSERYIRTESGTNRAVLHYPVRPFTDGADQ